jgi:hypothetical protein
LRQVNNKFCFVCGREEKMMSTNSFLSKWTTFLQLTIKSHRIDIHSFSFWFVFSSHHTERDEDYFALVLLLFATVSTTWGIPRRCTWQWDFDAGDDKFQWPLFHEPTHKNMMLTVLDILNWWERKIENVL